MNELSSAPGFLRHTLGLFLCLFGLATAHAQSVRWESSDSGDPSELMLVFEDCAPEGDPQLPRLDGTTLTFTGRSEQTSIVNFSMTRSTILSYRARSQRSGAIQIPAFTVQTNKGALRVPAFSGGATRSAADANVVARLETGSTSVWAGEVFPVTYVLDVARRAFNQLGSLVEWNSAPLVIEEWSKFEPSEAMTNGESRLHLTAKTRGYAKTPGPLTLEAATQLVNLQSGSIGFGLFQTPRIEQLSVTSNQSALVVRPLPPAPAGFSGAVGQFTLTSKVVPTNAAVGEPVTWTLELSGTGNWPDIAGLPQREVARDFNVVQPQAKRTPAEGKLFDVTLTEDVVLVPTNAGNYTLGPVNFTYFDPESGSYKTISTPRTPLSIAPAAAPVTGASTTPRSTDTPADAGRTAFNPQVPAPPEAPSAIPRDPLPGSAIAMTPLRQSSLLFLAVAPWLLLPFWWIWLAAQRARATDPLNPRRAARQRLAATLAQLRHSSAPTLNSPPLVAWQHDTAILWEIPHAAPPAAAITDAAWARLWQEADRALYSPDTALPTDWVSRAEAALAAKNIPGFSPLRLFRPRNLFPFVALLVLSATLAPFATAQSNASSPQPSADPAAAYRNGEFAAAQAAWANTVAKSPTDAIARHNLSLAFAQQDRWAEAAAHASAAFVQNPSNDAVRWQLALAADQAGYVPAPLARFFPAGPLHALARLANPARWQILLLFSSLLAAAACGALIFGAYHRPSRARTATALALIGLGLIAGSSAFASLHAYSSAADSRAVVAWRAGTLRSIPTEADNTQKTTVLPPGSVALADRTFLGWIRLTFDNGQTGWVRKEEVVPLWR